MNTDPIRQLLLELLAANGTDLKNASRAIGRNAAYLHQYIHRGTPRVLPETVREALGPLLGGDPAKLRPASPPPKRPAAMGSRRSQEEEPPAPRGVAQATPPPQRVERGEGSVGITGQSNAAGALPVGEIDVAVSAGPGANHDGPESTPAVWMFPEAVVRHEFHAKPEDLRIITVEGDSMEPLLGSGDRILVDTSRRLPVPPGVFVIWDGMGLVAKRIEHIPNSTPTTVMIRSVNPAYPAYKRLAEEVHIIGRVIWVAKQL